MSEIHLHYLNHLDVQALAMTDAESIGAVEQALHAQGLGETAIEPRMHLGPEMEDPGHFNVMRGYMRPL
jgi:alanine dehydrogenase